MRIPTAVAAAASAALVGCGLSACSPVIRPVLGVTSRDGVPTALVYGCDDPSSLSVMALPQPGPTRSDAGIPGPLTVQTPASPSPSGPRFRYCGIRSAGDVSGAQEIVLLAPPPAGWRTQSPAADVDHAPLTTWEPQDEYDVHARDAYELRLTGRDLAAAPAGDVLVATGYGSPAVMSRAAFEAQARESC